MPMQMTVGQVERDNAGSPTAGFSTNAPAPASWPKARHGWISPDRKPSVAEMALAFSEEQGP
jgi:hypothetical protein